MIHSIPAEDKQAFLQCFINYHRPQKRECIWILNYLIQHPDILHHIHFVQDIAYCPRGMMIASVCSDSIPFMFYKNQIMTTNTEKAFHDIRLNKNISLYIELRFKESERNPYLAGIKEENPFLTHEQVITNADKKLAGQLLQYTFYTYKEERLKRQIDCALDQYNEQLFSDLVKQLNTLKASHINPFDV